jgi:hypothetical protein
VTTLAALCAEHAPEEIDFLKIDVEGAEGAVVRGGDWKRFRPKVVLLEALAPYTLAPAWDEWEPLLLSNGYRYAFFDSLNRYYVAEEAERLAQALADAPAAYEAVRFAEMKPALEEPRHPDYRLAELLARAALIRMPLLDASQAADLLAAEASAHDLASPATDVAMAAAWERVFGRPPLAGEVEALGVAPGGALHEFYARLCASEAFRIACGRISGSYAW